MVQFIQTSRFCENVTFILLLFLDNVNYMQQNCTSLPANTDPSKSLLHNINVNNTRVIVHPRQIAVVEFAGFSLAREPSELSLTDFDGLRICVQSTKKYFFISLSQMKITDFVIFSEYLRNCNAYEKKCFIRKVHDILFFFLYNSVFIFFENIQLKKNPRNCSNL